MPNADDFKKDLLAASRIVKPSWDRAEERKRLIVLARQLYHAGIILHDPDALLAGVAPEPQNPFEAMFMRGPRKPTFDYIDWESLERVVLKYFPDEVFVSAENDRLNNGGVPRRR